MEQLSIIVRGYWKYNENRGWNDNTEDLDKYLSNGWKVVSVSPMGAYGYSANNDALSNGFASLVIIQKADQPTNILLKGKFSTIYVNEYLRGEIDKYTDSMKSEDLLFPSRKGDSHITPSQVYRMLKNLRNGRN